MLPNATAETQRRYEIVTHEGTRFSVLAFDYSEARHAANTKLAKMRRRERLYSIVLAD